MDFSVVLPAYNEEKNIVETIHQFTKELRNYEFEIIVVDDGSVDSTSSLVTNLQNSIPNVELVRHSFNKGYGAALRTGFSNAKSPWCFFTDSDLQFHPRDFHRLWSQINNYDIILGYRSPRRDPFMRRLNAKMWGLYVRNFFGVNVRDLNCAFKLFRTELLSDVELKSDGAFINAELLSHLFQTGTSVCEVPVSHFSRKKGNQTGANFSVILSAFQESLQFHNRYR